MISAAGVRFLVTPEPFLSAGDREYLATFPQGDGSERHTFEIRLQNSADDATKTRSAGGEPVMSCDGRSIHLTHEDFSAVILPFDRVAEVRRTRGGNQALFSTIRICLAGFLPLVDEVLLHSASAVVDGRAVIFLGRSGIGKSTLMGTSPHPVLADEWVAASASPAPLARATPFWSSYWRPGLRPLPGVFPIAALGILERNETSYLKAAPQDELFKHLLASAIVPPLEELWNRTLPLLRSLSRVEGFRIAWTLGTPPWEEVEKHLASRLGSR